MVILPTYMGLRADEARKILVDNQYNQKKFAHANRAANDGAGYLYATIASISGFAGKAVEQTYRCSIEWIKDPDSCEFEKSTFISMVAGGVLGVAASYSLLSRLDSREISEVDRINALRASVMDVIKKNYNGCDFHSPLKGVHIAALLALTDGNTQKRLLEQLSHAQAVQALRESSNCIQKLQSMASYEGTNAMKETDWLNEIRSERRLWKSLESSLKSCDVKEIRKAFKICSEKFDQRSVESFVKKRITVENLRQVNALGGNISKMCQSFYKIHKAEIDRKNYFESSDWL